MVPSAVLLQELAATAGSRVARSYTIIDLSMFSLARALRAVGARGNYWSTSSHAPPAYRSSSRSSLCLSGPLPSWRLRLATHRKLSWIMLSSPAGPHFGRSCRPFTISTNRGLHCDEAAPAKCRARFPRHAPPPRYGLWYNYCHGTPPLAHSSTRSE